MSRRLVWQGGILAVLREDAEMNKAIKTAATKQAEQIKIFDVRVIRE
jgi:hypothetical protein